MALKHRNEISSPNGNLSLVILLFFITVAFAGCAISYSFTGGSTGDAKTISIQYFQNRASIVQPSLSQDLTDALTDMCKTQTKLNFVSDGADVNFEGEITDYSTKTQTIASNNQAATNRFTITVKVKFTNTIDSKLSFEQTFSQYQDYDSSYDLSSVEDELSKEIVKLLVEDIYNKAFVNW